MSDDEEENGITKEILALTSVTSDQLVSHHCHSENFRVPIAEAESDDCDDEDGDDEEEEEDMHCQVYLIFDIRLKTTLNLKV